MDLDEYIFALLEACNGNWTGHASDSDSEDTRSVDEEARNERETSITEMKEELERQRAQIESQQEELMLQRAQATRQNDEIAMLRGIVQQIQDSLTQSIPQSQSPPDAGEVATLQAAGLEDVKLEKDAGRDGVVDEGEDLNQVPRDETTFEMREQVIGRRRLEYPAMQNELEEPRGEVPASADANTSTSDVENDVECEEEKGEEL